MSTSANAAVITFCLQYISLVTVSDWFFLTALGLHPSEGASYRARDVVHRLAFLI